MRNFLVFGLMMLPVALFGQSKSKKEQHFKPDTTVYTSVEVMPEFPGGREKLGAYLLKADIPLDTTEYFQNRFLIQVIVEKDGHLTHVQIKKVLNKAACKAYVEYIRRSPKWKPGLLHNKPVRVAYSFPIILEPASDE